MELHSYAKSRVLNKWTIVQKRKLIEERIKYDSIFNNMPNNSLGPWKKLLSAAKMENFSVSFVRKRWSKILQTYTRYKKLLNAESKNEVVPTVQSLTEKWEHFETIHKFMTNKTNSLHSYAIKPTCSMDILYTIPDQQSVDYNFSSSSDDDNILDNCQTPIPISRHSNSKQKSNDHDCYSKKPISIYEETTDTKNLLNHQNFSGSQSQLIVPQKVIEPSSHAEKSQTKEECEHLCGRNVTNPGRPNKKYLTERDKYYRHKRRFNRRLECRFDNLLNVIGQVIRAEYPNINVSSLLEETQCNLSAVGQLFSSDDEYDTNTSDESGSNNIEENSDQVQNGKVEPQIHSQNGQQTC